MVGNSDSCYNQLGKDLESPPVDLVQQVSEGKRSRHSDDLPTDRVRDQNFFHNVENEVHSEGGRNFGVELEDAGMF